MALSLALFKLKSKSLLFVKERTILFPILGVTNHASLYPPQGFTPAPLSPAYNMNHGWVISRHDIKRLKSGYINVFGLDIVRPLDNMVGDAMPSLCTHEAEEGVEAFLVFFCFAGFP